MKPDCFMTSEGMFYPIMLLVLPWSVCSVPTLFVTVKHFDGRHDLNKWFELARFDEVIVPAHSRNCLSVVQRCRDAVEQYASGTTQMVF